jgi:diadenosine tetraphosphate (Ap4A) HIT family hydrolase
MPETSQQFYDRVNAAAHAQPDGRLRVPEPFGDAEIFPYEYDALRVREFEPPVVPEPPRSGEPGGAPCGRCARGDDGAIWGNERWLLVPGDVEALPFAALLMPREHADLGDLDAASAAEMGQLIVAVERAVKTLGDIGRVHVYVWADGGAHLHVWFIARPLGLLQLRGSCLADWTEVLPALPEDLLVANRRLVAQALVTSSGGSTLLG